VCDAELAGFTTVQSGPPLLANDNSAARPANTVKESWRGHGFLTAVEATVLAKAKGPRVRRKKIRPRFRAETEGSGRGRNQEFFASQSIRQGLKA